ncbi:putative DNA-binding transcriptional regulator YafY [Allocatelliglobosispora scoriae]|uniref:Putative DNA-binding transcriptional regulator YafY n=1 Tax=Allocatelliglobosispora scoriae TaxID=643052 RepID=A0A841C1T6_9ACTN|nr:YafY family protein [Allocatelliglobosispora scoriae]MBB5873718.1 putative DNA-binding transcriptional regulator YafY [Allocatelliglobosispora scoriae]
MRSSRLVSILMLLQAQHRLTAREIAAELEVSLRTVYRDVEALAAAGIPIYAEQGRAGGYRLVDGYRTRLTGLTEAEAQSLFMVGLPGPAMALGLGAEAASAERKLLAALAPEQRVRAGELRDRFHLDIPAWYRQAEDAPHLAAIAEAVLNDRVVAVTYRRWKAPREVERRLSPYGLVLKSGTWYVVAGTGEGTRTYRISNILRLTPAAEHFERPHRFDLAAFWQQHLDEFDQRRITATAVLRLSARLVGQLPDKSDPALRKAAAGVLPDPDGWTTVEFPVEHDAEAARQLLRYGAEVRVLAPESLRDALLAVARAVLAVHDEPVTPGRSSVGAAG